MAYTRLPIHLSLDECAEILALNPAHFNQAVADGTAYAPCSAECIDLWCNESWQTLRGLSRASLAQAILQAEMEVAAFVGAQSLTPRIQRKLFEIEAPSDTAQPFTQTQFFIGPHLVDYVPCTPFYLDTVTLLPNDEDGDGWDEDFILSITTDAPIDADNIVMYVAGHFGDEAFRIRPVTYLGALDGVVTASIKPWQAIAPAHLASPASQNCSCLALDLTDDIYIGDADVGYMRADNTQHTVHFYYDDGISCGDPLCTPCAEQRVEGVFRSLGNRITAFPAQYDSESDTWEPYTDDCICGRWPYAAEVTYYTSYCPPTPRNELCPELREIVALLAGARVQVNDCDCDCGAGQWFRSLQKDLAIVTGAGRYVSPSKLDNPFGTRQGEQMAYDRLRALVGTNTVVVKHGRY